MHWQKDAPSRILELIPYHNNNGRQEMDVSMHILPRDCGHRRRLICSVLIGVLPFITTRSEGDAERFPFVIPGYDATPSATNFSYLNPQPAGDAGFVRVQNGHFATDAGRLRIWGVNLGFAANFPTHEAAEKAAAHLAKLGVNGVRFHHFETAYSPSGILKKDGTFDPEMVDRMDYFMAQLHRHGIYANINLHVGNTPSKRSGLPGLGDAHYARADKHALHFMPEIQSEILAFWREMVTHRNPYRNNLRRADDPGIAQFEMCNENKFTEAGPGMLQRAPVPYRAVILKRWNQWLRDRYKDTSSLRTAWGKTNPSPAQPLAHSSQWGAESIPGWSFLDGGGKWPFAVTKRSENGHTVLRLKPQQEEQEASEHFWQQQFVFEPLNLNKGKMYSLRFDLRTDVARQSTVDLGITKNGFESLGLTQTIASSPEWKSYLYQFEASRNARDEGRLAIGFGNSLVAVELRNLELREGGGTTLLPTEQSIETGNVAIPDQKWVIPAQAAFKDFMHDTERAFYRGAKALLVEELGVKVPVTTTQANYQPADILAEFADFTDMHAYWHHPIFHGKEWSNQDWTVGSEPLEAFPFHTKWPRVSMLMRASWRHHGKPFTFSEWNTGEPGFFSAGGIPIAALLSALQDWDGFYFFNYQTGADWEVDGLRNYFSINGQPVKTALFSAFANLYRRGDLSALPEAISAAPGHQEGLGGLALRFRVGIDPALAPTDSHPAPTAEQLQERAAMLQETPDKTVRWDAREAEKAHIVLNTPATRAVWGLIGGRTFKIGTWELDISATERDYAVVVATSRDGKPLEQSNSILITAVGNAENPDMKWNADRTSVGKNWGTEPAVINGIPLTLRFPESQSARRIFALDGAGKRIQEIPIALSPNGHRVAHLGPKWKTLWYELSVD